MVDILGSDTCECSNLIEISDIRGLETLIITINYHYCNTITELCIWPSMPCPYHMSA